MKRFRFRLEKLLELRAFHERRAEILLAEKAGRVAILETSLAENAISRAASRREMFAPGRVLADFRATELYVLRLDREREGLVALLAAAELEREAARLAYVEKRRGRELMDKLKERRQTEYYRLAEREEIKALDDLARRPAVEARG